jgi:NADPH:quinone reductase-like Zn-dependent oxidoreductase
MTTVPNVIARRPITPEYDFAGVIVDANGSEFSAGDEVIGFIALGEYCSLPPCVYHTDACG